MQKAFKNIAIFLIRGYQILIAPLWRLISPYSGCVFLPTCSEYTILAIKKYGVFRGVALGIKRISRCRPGNGPDYDLVP